MDEPRAACRESRLSPSSRLAGAVSQAADEIAFPSGIAATPDNSTLIIAESFGGRLTAYDIVTDGRLQPRVWA